MHPAFGFTLTLVFVFGLPAGLILLVLGLFRRGPANMCDCGYSRSGLPPHALCPECGGPLPQRCEVPRVRWQIYVGISLLVLAGLAALVFVAGLVRTVLYQD